MISTSKTPRVVTVTTSYISDTAFASKRIRKPISMHHFISRDTSVYHQPLPPKRERDHKYSIPPIVHRLIATFVMSDNKAINPMATSSPPWCVDDTALSCGRPHSLLPPGRRFGARFRMTRLHILTCGSDLAGDTTPKQPGRPQAKAKGTWPAKENSGPGQQRTRRTRRPISR